MEELMDSQVEFANDPSLGANNLITYNHISGTIVKNLGVFVGKPKFNDKEKNNQRVDKIEFTNVNLSIEPTNNDTIEYNNTVYKVEEWIFATGLYIIQAYANKHHSASQRK